MLAESCDRCLYKDLGPAILNSRGSCPLTVTTFDDFNDALRKLTTVTQDGLRIS